MTNNQTESLLSRFAAVPQRLKGTGAPGVPDDIDLKTQCIKARVDEVWSTKPEWCYSPTSCLRGCVMWAMEVAEWHFDNSVMLWSNPEKILVQLESIADAVGGGE